MNHPKLAICNFEAVADRLREMAFDNGFSGVDWTLKVEDLPADAFQEAALLRSITRLEPLEIRYHCAFEGFDLGDEDTSKAMAANDIFRKACRTVQRLGGRFMTIHMGLGRTSMNGLSWERTLRALEILVNYGAGLGVRVCLENLAAGWSSRPELFEKLVRKSHAGVTLDLGHARVCSSVETRRFDIEDFVLPHPAKVFNAHVYHEERDGRHLPPPSLDDISDRLGLLSCLACDWWVLELREEEALRSTLKVVKEFLESNPQRFSLERFGIE